jgi:hypothetical protein
LPLLALCLLGAAWFIACASPRTPMPWSDGDQPTSVPINAVSP